MDKPQLLSLELQDMFLLHTGVRSGIIVITERSQYRGDVFQLIQHVVSVNITGMKNKVDTLEGFQYLRREFLPFPGNMCI